MIENETNQTSILKEEIRRLKIAIEELSALNDVATAITSNQSVEDVIDLIVRKCIKHLKAQQTVVMLLDEKDMANPFHTMIRKQDSISEYLPYRLDTQLTGWMLKNRSPLLINDFQKDERFKFVITKDFPIYSLLSVPMLLKGKMIGLLTVFNKHSDSGFTIEDQRMLSILAAQSSHIIENARLYEKEQALTRLQEEMRLANDIQVNLLPKSTPQISGYQISGKSIPAKDVGGDYFDFIPLKDNLLAFCIGDISGKGIPAALLMANLQASLRGQTLMDIPCKNCVTFTNNLLFNSTDSNKYATLFYGVLLSSQNKITFCNAGHNEPILIDHDGEVTRLKEGGIVVGILPDMTYVEKTIDFPAESILVVYSDGITEAMDSKEEEFGEERLINLIKENRILSASDLIKLIIETVNNHAGNAEQMDDMTLVVIKRV
ncbi:MAG: GAF domain-containing SpoIIE family protein phosphatase [Ignavibacteriaceae bacterium]